MSDGQTIVDPVKSPEEVAKWWVEYADELARFLGRGRRADDDESVRVCVVPRVEIGNRPGFVVVQADPITGGLTVGVAPVSASGGIPFGRPDPERAAQETAAAAFHAVRRASMSADESPVEERRPAEYEMPGPLGRVDQLPAEDSTQYARRVEGMRRARMSKVCACFPTLLGLPGVEPWDPELLERQAGGSGLRHSVAFVLSVWRGAGFDSSSALMVWDRQHRAAFVAWAADPWWC